MRGVKRRKQTRRFVGNVVILLLSAAGSACTDDPRWGLLASPGWVQQPMKGVFFFTGEGACQASARDIQPSRPPVPDEWRDLPVQQFPLDRETPRLELSPNIPDDGTWPCHLVDPDWLLNSKHYTYTPIDPRDLHWNDSGNNRTWAVNQIASTHANVIVMSRWGNEVNNGAPMQGTVESNDQLFDAINATRNVLVMPAIDTFTSKGRRDFRTDYPGNPAYPAPQLLAEVVDITSRYFLNPNRRRWWAQIYDQNGIPRYAINWIHAASTYNHDGCEFAHGLDWIADRILEQYGVHIGFTIDPFNAFQHNDVPNFNCYKGYCPSPYNSCLNQARSFLGIQGFDSEIVRAGDLEGAGHLPNPWAGKWSSPPSNANDRITMVIAWKRKWIEEWIKTGVPVIFDVSPGYDGRYVFAEGVIYGDNADEMFDAWRNAQSALKGLGMKGTVYNAWNGYTEGLVATPGVWVKPQNVRRLDGRSPDGLKNWLTDYFSVDPRVCSHTHYVNFGQTKYHVYGAICQKWQAMDANIDALGSPASSETAGCKGARRTHFQFGSIIHSGRGAHETHGLIGSLYRDMNYECGWLGVPTSDEIDCHRRCQGGRTNDFENGHIDWCPGWSSARASLGPSGC